MRILKIASALVTMLAFTAIATATASAAETLWEWLPGETGTEFTGESGKAKLQVKGGASITCTQSRILNKEGSITGERTLALAWIHFTGCKTLGTPVNSLGDESEIILVQVHIHNCLIEPGGEDGHLGWLLKVSPLHLEVPSVSLLLSVQGSLVVLMTTAGRMAKTFAPVVEQTAGQQKVGKCEGGKPEYKLETSTDGGEFAQSGLEVKEGTITFAAEQDVMA